MHRILVFITLSESGIEIIKSNHELPENEMEFINKWKKGKSKTEILNISLPYAS